LFSVADKNKRCGTTSSLYLDLQIFKNLSELVREREREREKEQRTKEPHTHMMTHVVRLKIQKIKIP
jgi:hypothetical protein